MKRSEIPRSGRSWAALRWAGIALSGAPVLLMLVTGIVGSVSSGQPRMDVLLPAELSLLTFPGMLLMALAAVKQRVYVRLSAVLPVIAAAALALCLVLSRTTRAGGFLWAALLLFDLAAVAAPVAGLLSVRRLRRRTSENREGPL